MDDEQRRHIEELLRINQRRLHKLEEQIALKGSDTPPHVLIEIEDARAEVERLEAVSGPAIPTLTRRHDNLPAPLTALIGRDRELADVCALLRHPDVRLVTLMGLGGVGKTRLSLQVAAELRNTFAHGCCFVDLASISEPDLVASTIARTLGVKEGNDQPLVELLMAYLREKRMLLLLDNFEQILDAAPLVSRLLTAAPGLKVLVTSRAVLRILGEREFTVSPLALPDLERPAHFADLANCPAIQLFIERVQAVRADFTLTEENWQAVTAICAQLDGLPLAIELAAARIKFLSPSTLSAKLADRFKLLSTGARDLPTRLQTLRAAMDWSYNLLSPDEQNMFARLAIFVGGCSVEAAESVCNLDSDLPIDVLDAMASLVDKSLLRQIAVGCDELHYTMLSTVHEYARGRLIQSDVAEAIARQHAAYYLALAELAEPQLTTAAQAAWLGRLEAEHDNLRAALRWALEAKEPAISLRLSAALWRFWFSRGHLSEGFLWLKRGLDETADAPAVLVAKALNGAGVLAWAQGDYPQAITLHKQALALYVKLGDKQRTAASINNLGRVVRDQGDSARATLLFQQSLALRRTLGNKRDIAISLFNLGTVMRDIDDYQRATEFYEQSLTLFQDVRDETNIAFVLSTLADIARRQGDYQRAVRLCEESLAFYRALEGRYGIAACLECLALIAAEQCWPQLAARLCGAAEVIRAEGGIRMEPACKAGYDRSIDMMRTQLGAVAFAAAWYAGRAMTPEQAIAEALAIGRTIEPP